MELLHDTKGEENGVNSEVSGACIGGSARVNETSQSLDDCGLLQNTCLPFLASVDKRKPLSPGHPNSRRKFPSKLSFKWREGHSDPILSACYFYVLIHVPLL